MNGRGGHGSVDARDHGFTLVELLIVIVILGVLAVVTVLAVRGITGNGNTNACATELNNLTTAQEVHLALEGTYGDEATLVANDAIRSESTMFEVTLTADGGYAIDPAADSDCTISATGNGDTSSGTTAAPDYTPIAPNGSYGSIGSAFQLPQPQGGPTPEVDEIVILGRSDATADINAAIADGTSTSRRVTFINLDEFSSDTDVDYVLNRADNNGFTELVVYAPDDTDTITRSGGGTWASVTAFVTDPATQAAYPNVTPRSFAFGTNSLVSLFASYP